MMMRRTSSDIVLVGSFPPPHGGQSIHIRQLAEYLKTQGLKVQVLNTGSDKHIREDGVISISSSRGLLRMLLFGPGFKLLHVHVSTPQDYGKLAPVALAAMLRRFPWLATVHSGHSAGQLRAAALPHRIVSRGLLASARRIICVNASIRSELSNLVANDVMVTIPPFSMDFFPSALGRELEAFFADHSPVICCVGLYEPAYGFDDAIRLIARIREIHSKAGLVLIGDMKGVGWCRTLIAELGVESHVKLCGNISHQECLAALGQSELFLRPTRYDGDSISVREALALRVPVVASATDFRPEGVTLYRQDVLDDLFSQVLRILGPRSARDSHSGCDSYTDNDNLEQVRQLYLKIVSA